MYIPHVVTGRCQGWVGNGSDILTVSIDQVVTWAMYGVKAQLDKRVVFAGILFSNALFFIQSHHQRGQLITEQNPGEHNPLIQLGLDTIHGSRHYLINTNSQDNWSISHSALATAGHHMGYVHHHFRQF